MELNEQTNSWIDEQSYKDEFERVEQFKKRNEFINMKILWLSGNPALYKRKSMIDGGWIGTLQKEIVKENIDLAIAFPYLKDDSSSEEDGVKYYPMYLPKWKKRIWYFNQKKVNGFFLHKIKQIIGDFRPDIIHCWGSELCYGLIAQYISIPVVMHIQGIINPIYQAFRPAGMDGFSILKASDYNLLKYYKLYCRANVVMKHQATRERDMLKHIKYFIGRTEWDRQVTRLMSPESTYYYCSEALRAHITNSPKWTCNSKRKLIISSTILPPLYKGADVILRTASILKTSYKGDFEWNIYGMNSIHLQEKFTGIKSGQVNVFCRGKVGPDILSEKLLKSDVFVHPSYIDNSPNSVCEAQYLGVPVIATYVGGIPSLIADGAGLLVPANDVYQTAWNIIRLKKDIDLAESISEKEITLAEKRHNLKTIVNDLLGVYEQIKRKNTDEI